MHLNLANGATSPDRRFIFQDDEFREGDSRASYCAATSRVDSQYAGLLEVPRPKGVNAARDRALRMLSNQPIDIDTIPGSLLRPPLHTAPLPRTQASCGLTVESDVSKAAKKSRRNRSLNGSIEFNAILEPLTTDPAPQPINDGVRLKPRPKSLPTAAQRRAQRRHELWHQLAALELEEKLAAQAAVPSLVTEVDWSSAKWEEDTMKEICLDLLDTHSLPIATDRQCVRLL